jgi:hypothetical protein
MHSRTTRASRNLAAANEMMIIAAIALATFARSGTGRGAYLPCQTGSGHCAIGPARVEAMGCRARIEQGLPCRFLSAVSKEAIHSVWQKNASFWRAVTRHNVGNNCSLPAQLLSCHTSLPVRLQGSVMAVMLGRCGRSERQSCAEGSINNDTTKSRRIND